MIVFGFSVQAKSSYNGMQAYNCAANCVERSYTGECVNYGPEYCGFDVQCVKRCEVRYFNETCGRYAADFCGTGATCKIRCYLSHRGTCDQYGPDHCYTND